MRLTTYESETGAGHERGGPNRRTRKGRVATMLHLPSSGYKVYEVSVYNRDVRALVKRKQRHCYFDDRWAAVQVRDVVARDESEARTLIAERFPTEDGFVVQGVCPSQF